MIANPTKNFIKVCCFRCKKDFLKAPCQIKIYKKKHFCSRECYQKEKIEKTLLIKVKCEYCGEFFLKSYSEIKRSIHNFCSQKCSHTKSVGEYSASWKGGSCVSRGYRLIRRNKATVFEHRSIMESHIGRPLKKEEIIHHINKNKLDNRIENLQITNREEHQKFHLSGRWSLKHDCCVCCGEISRCHRSHGFCERCGSRNRKKRAAKPIAK